MRRRALAGMAATGVVVAAALVLPLGGEQDVEIPDDGPWVVFVSDFARDSSSCANDPAVALSYQAAIDPPAGFTAELDLDATRADVERVVGCLLDRISATDIEVHTRSW